MATKNIWRGLFGGIVLVTALVYLCVLVARDFERFRDAVYSLSPLQFAGAILAAVVYLLLKATYHVLLSKRMSGRDRLAGEVLPAYTIAQVIRYLPGKIWGILYQANRPGSTLRPREVIGANTIQMVTTNLLGAGVIVSILTAVYYDSVLPLAGLVLAAGAIEVIHRNPLLERWFLALVGRLTKNVVPEVVAAPFLRWKGTLILLGEWVAYFIVWLIVTDGQMGFQAAVILGTWYAAASLLAILVIVVPAGVAVREAIFVVMSGTTGTDVGLLIGFAAILRVILTLGELTCVPVTLLIKRLLASR